MVEENEAPEATVATETASEDQAAEAEAEAAEQVSEDIAEQVASTAPTEPVVLTPRDLALAAKVNEVVIAPGIDEKTEVFVQHKYRAGGVLLTADGEGLYDGECKHKGQEVPMAELQYFEFVGGDRDGTHGFLHRKRGCQRAYEMETPAEATATSA